MTPRISHIGVAVRSLEEALAVWRDQLGLPLLRIEEVPTEGVRVAILDAGGTHVELLEPTAPGSPIARFLERRGGGIHHLALGVDDVGATSDRLGQGGVEFIGETARPGAGGARVSFIHPRSTGGILLELTGGA